jgi:transposase InsO family protein
MGPVWVVAAVVGVALDLMRLRVVAFRRRVDLAAEVMLLRKQLAILSERQGRRQVRVRPLQRCSLAVLSRLCAWREAVIVVRPATIIRWHRAGFRLLWRWKSRRVGRPPLPESLRTLIAEMARDNPTWGEGRIAGELSLKLGLRVSPRTVRRYMPKGPGGYGLRGRGDQRWATFVRNHAEAIVACDLFVSVTATFRVLYVFVMMEIGSRRILHCNVTAHPTAEWTLQQLRQAIPCDHGWRFLIHDRDSIFSKALDQTLKRMGLRVLKTPIRAPKANAFAERLVGTVRRECLDWLIPFSENHLRRILLEWVCHYNEARPHSSLGPGISNPPEGLPVLPQEHRHRLPVGSRVVTSPILGGLHHEYRLDTAA